ncbi:MAG: response regulator transcription factor [Pseudanabaenaceae cyanobacterium bins.39]|nr:response regulator transcription factor [Pseudanabaenaceae cyanobacterium bins.39]
MRILLVEDDDYIAKPVAKDIRHQGHVIDVASDGISGWEYAQAVEYDLILLDLMLPRLDGISLCKKLRETGCKTHILMLTAKDTTADKILGLDTGADDYLVKPFDLEELAARIRALSRRVIELRQPVINHGLLQLDENTHAIAYNGQPLALTPKEYVILECLIRSPTQVFTRAALLDKLWDLDKISSEETIRTHITNIRRKLKAAGSDEDLIQTMYGVGYALKGD